MYVCERAFGVCTLVYVVGEAEKQQQNSKKKTANRQ